MIKEISHIGVVVSNLEETIDLYRSVFQVEASTPTIVRDMKISMLQVGNAKIEFMEPVGGEGTLAKFLEKRGEGIHHICFEVDDIELALETLAAKGIELVDRKPRSGAEGRIAFIHPKAMRGVLIELVEKT